MNVVKIGIVVICQVKSIFMKFYLGQIFTTKTQSALDQQNESGKQSIICHLQSLQN